jgi:hypothetical protein
MSDNRDTLYKRIKETEWSESNPSGDFISKFDEQGLGQIELVLFNAMLTSGKQLAVNKVRIHCMF